MILWKSKEIKEVVPLFADMGQRSWRWIIEVDNWCAGFYHQVKFEKYDDWKYAGSYYYIGFSRWFRLGFDHAYYDGPHCVFSLGYLHLCYTGLPWEHGWCKKNACLMIFIQKNK